MLKHLFFVGVSLSIEGQQAELNNKFLDRIKTSHELTETQTEQLFNVYRRYMQIKHQHVQYFARRTDELKRQSIPIESNKK